jgi:site-specific DNA-methyltransferase (adenine-specific)
MPDLGPADLVIADPPYGIGLNTNWTARTPTRAAQKAGVVAWARDYPPVRNDDQPFDPAPLLHFPKLVVFGANNFAQHLPLGGDWLVWDKRRGGTVTPGWRANDAELAWTNIGGGMVRVFSHLWAGYKRDSEHGQHYGPTQKPIALMAWIIQRYTKPGDLVLDPYMGTGPVLLAAAALGRRAVGIDLEAKCCETAKTRLEQRPRGN